MSFAQYSHLFKPEGNINVYVRFDICFFTQLKMQTQIEQHLQKISSHPMDTCKDKPFRKPEEDGNFVAGSQETSRYKSEKNDNNIT